ncbi:hypothetical protein ACFPYI_02190 [Halomarina salina]|uniref:SPW repeat-containing protein n=1 Tax=Halomarina salina TaxID=1872699 RepID=A0ABD5RI43_9EURY|nr:hypothetical protein [Halomarina salina]
MERTSHEQDRERESVSTLGATVDVLLAAFGLWLVCWPLAGVANAVAGTPLTESQVSLLVGCVALGGSYPFVAGDWSLGRLGDFVFALAASALALGVLGLFAVLLSGIELSGSDPVPQFVTVACAYVVAAVVVYWRD